MDVKLFSVNMVLEADIVLGRFAAAALPSARCGGGGGDSPCEIQITVLSLVEKKNQKAAWF